MVVSERKKVMQLSWKATTFLVCVYGLCKELRPAVPFLTPYLLSPFKNFTDRQVYSQIYPIWTYSYLLALIPVFFLTDLLRYKPAVILESLSLIATWTLLVWGRPLFHMQLMQVVFGVASAAEIGYYAYIYAAVDAQHYKRVTSYVRSATLLGRTVAYAAGQVLVSTDTADYLLLNHISLISVSVTLVIALFLPWPPPSSSSSSSSSTITHTDENTMIKNADQTREQKKEGSLLVSEHKTPAELQSNEAKCYLYGIWDRFRRDLLGNWFVLRWSLWWSLASCGMFQVWNYMQTLWAVMQTDTESVQNGLTECAATLIGAAVAFSMQFLSFDWAKYGELVLTISALCEAGLLILAAQTTNIHLSYVIYIVVCAIYQMLITVASHNVASKLQLSSYGLVFGWNTFVALFLQTILTISVADSRGFALDIRQQFIVYGAYFAAIALIFLMLTLYRAARRCPTVTV